MDMKKNIFKFGVLAATAFALSLSPEIAQGEVSASSGKKVSISQMRKSADTFVKEGVQYNLDTPANEAFDVTEWAKNIPGTAGNRFFNGLSDIVLPDGRIRVSVCNYDTKNLICDKSKVVFSAEFNKKDGIIQPTKELINKYNQFFKKGDSKDYHFTTKRIGPVIGEDNKDLASSFYLALSVGSPEISRINYNSSTDEYPKVETSIMVLDGELHYGSPEKRSLDGVLKDFIIAGAVRPFEGQDGLVIGYQKALVNNANDRGNVGVSVFAQNKGYLPNMLGQTAYGPNGEEIVITPEILEESLRNHIMAESIAAHYNANQNLENGYRIDVSDIAELNKAGKFLSETPIARILFPVNNIVQGGLGNSRTKEGEVKPSNSDYTLHTTNDRVEALNKAGLVVDRANFGTNLTDFETGIEARVKKYFNGGNLK